jgi:hypothetical protein
MVKKKHTDKPHFWRDGKGRWCCAVPRDDYATRAGFDWKHFGLIGRGVTPKSAFCDWKLWQQASAFVADIY